MSKAQNFIDLLVSQDLLAPEIVEELNRQVAESKGKLSPELLAKLLVDNGHLTKFQATKLVSQIRDGNEVQAGGSADADDELGLAPEGDEPPAEDGVAAIILDEPEEGVEAEVVEVVEAAEVVEAEEEIFDVTAVSGFESVAETEDSDLGADVPRRPVRPAKAVDKSNPWDSFKILGVAFILVLVCIAGFFLVRFFVYENAEKIIERADSSYEQRSYETAFQAYDDFIVNYPTNEQQSYAKVRSALAKFRNAAEKVPDPVKGLETALEVLPAIASEDALREEGQANDLAGALISLAEKFTERADAESEISQRKLLMDEMDKLLEMINNPQFVANAQREIQRPTLMRILEDRQRILREISRDEELAQALVEIDGKLGEKDVMGAYQVREKLIDQYPLLKSSGELLTRVQQATSIQKTLVQPSSISPRMIDNPIEAEQGGRIVIANRYGGKAPSLAGRVVTVRVKGSIYGLDGESGSVLWRQFVGRGLDSYPVPLGDGPGTDFALADPATGVVSRVAAKTGDIVWSVDFGTSIHVPVYESESVFVATHDGSIICLDAAGGQTRWATKLPQPVPVGPTVAFGRSQLYVPGQHSNLYVLSRDNGACEQVHYMDHQSGALAVAPVLFQGQLFVFDNISSDVSNIRFLDVDEAGQVTGETQPHVQIGGNVVVPPTISGRRLFVQSDLSAIAVLDVELNADADRVSVIATIPENAAQPTRSWAVADRSKLWLADERLTRFDLQVTSQRLDRISTIHDGDVFTGPLQKFDDVIIHSRRLRGNRGVRVTAMDAEADRELWSVDLGVPVVMVVPAGGNQYDVVNSGGAYFSFDGSKRIFENADLNPGGGKANMTFDAPVALQDGRVVMINRSRANQLMVYSPTGTKLQVLSTSLGQAELSSDPVAVGNLVGIGLDNGQFVLVDPTTGVRAGAPYQPALEPNSKKVVWNRGVYLEDQKTLIVANDRMKLARLGTSGDLRMLSEADLQSPLRGPLCTVGDSVCAVADTGGGESLLFFNANSLAAVGSSPIEGNVVAGPFTTEGGCLVQTDRKLMMIAADQSLVWSSEFPRSAISSPPLEAQGKIVVTNRQGQLFVIDASSGEILGDSDTRQAFTSKPVPARGGVFIGSDEGAVMALPLPTTVSSGGQ